MKNEIRMGISKENIEKMNENISIHINKLTDLKCELYLFNIALIFEKYKEIIDYYEINVNQDLDEKKYFFDIDFDIKENVELSEVQKAEINDCIKSENILTKDMKDTLAWKVHYYHNDKITIWTEDNEDILLKLAQYIYGVEEGELWYKEKNALTLSEKLEKELPIKNKIKKRKI